VAETILVQRGLLSRTSFLLQEDSVSVEETSPFWRKRYVALYESIPRDPVELTLRSRGWKRILYVAVVILGSTVFAANNDLVGRPVFLFWAVFFVVAALRYATSKRTYLVFQSGTPALVFLKNRPSGVAVQEFIARLQERKAERLRGQLLDAQGVTPAGEIHKLAWLKEQGAISEEEFERLKRAVVEAAPPAPEPGPETIH
jgi:hypothetical protein